LTYHIDESKRIISIMEAYHKKVPDQKISIKLHPNHLLTKPFDYPDSWEYTEDSLAEACRESYIVVTSGSGAANEAAIMGCSVIVVGNDEGLTLNSMPEYGKGLIWDLAFDQRELEEMIDRLSRYRSENPDKIVEMANRLRDMFFTKATEQKYIELFDL
jgi:hypothetical protein